MPITQDRLISLIDLISTIIQKEQIAIIHNAEIARQMNVLYISNKSDAEKIDELFHLAGEATLVLEQYLPTIDPSLMANFYREQEHFRLARKRNAKAKAAMERLRERQSGTLEKLKKPDKELTDDDLAGIAAMEKLLWPTAPSTQPPAEPSTELEPEDEDEGTDWSKVPVENLTVPIKPKESLETKED